MNYWWGQFPPNLRLITKARLVASLGAGGVIYLTPLVFNQLSLSATEIGQGIALAAVAGTFSRLIVGRLLDRGTPTSGPIKWAAITAIAADICLISANDQYNFLIGQLLFGIAAGLYWPAIELAVPNNIENYPSIKGFALVRSADAVGMSFGALVGSLFAFIELIRVVYFIDVLCMGFLLILLEVNTINESDNKFNALNIESKIDIYNRQDNYRWLKSLMPILLISLIGTSILSLLQSALPLDLAKGGVNRPALNEGWSGIVIAIQLGLLVFFQWPIGRWISKYDAKFGLRISMAFFAIGCLLIGLSSLYKYGIYILIIGIFNISIGIAAFLPTATELIIETPPKEKRGISMALFSQCFALSGLAAPIISGKIIDNNDSALMVWISMFICTIITIIFLKIFKEIK